jgi:hypothetical protein
MDEIHYGQISDMECTLDRASRLANLIGLPDFDEMLTFHAVYVLWYRLTQALYPDDAPTMTSSAGTAPLDMPEDLVVTIGVDLMRLDSEPDHYDIIGTTTQGRWRARISQAESQRLWAVLDVALFPVGWNGREIKPRDNGSDAAHTR